MAHSEPKTPETSTPAAAEIQAEADNVSQNDGCVCFDALMQLAEKLARPVLLAPFSGRGKLAVRPVADVGEVGSYRRLRNWQILFPPASTWDSPNTTVLHDWGN